MPRKNIKARANSYTREQERNRRRARLAARKAHRPMTAEARKADER